MRQLLTLCPWEAEGNKCWCSFPSFCHLAQSPSPGSGDAHIQDGYSLISETSLETLQVTNSGVRFHGHHKSSQVDDGTERLRLCPSQT